MPKFGTLAYSPSTRRSAYSYGFTDATMLTGGADYWLAFALGMSRKQGW